MLEIEKLSAQLSQCIGLQKKECPPLSEDASLPISEKKWGKIKQFIKTNILNELPFPSEDTIKKAQQNLMEAFIEEKNISPEILYILSFSLNLNFLDKNHTLFEENKIFDYLLNNYKKSGLSYLIWKNLLNQYFLYSEWQFDPLGRQNWEKLKEYLNHSFLPMAKNTRLKQNWMTILYQNLNLFEAEPSVKYVQLVYNGKLDPITQISQALKIPLKTWFWDCLSEDYIQLITQKNDLIFKTKMNYSFEMLQFASERKKEALLIQILQRFFKLKDRPVQAQLKEILFEAWGHPYFGQPQWKKVAGARELIRYWSIQEHLNDFFTLINKENKKYQFWMKYSKRIQFSSLILDPACLELPRFRFLKQRKPFSYVSLTGNPTTTPFAILLMKIGETVILHFEQPNTPLLLFFEKKLGLTYQENQLDYTTLFLPQQAEWKFIYKGDWSLLLQKQLSAFQILANTPAK